MTGTVNTPKGVDLCRRTVNTYVGLAVVVTVQDSGGVSELDLVDIQCNVQMLRRTESDYIKLKKRPILDSFMQFVGHKKRKEQWPSAIKFP